MIRNWVVFFIALGLMALGSAVFFYKAAHLSFPLVPDGTFNSWYVEFSVRPEVKKQARKDNSSRIRIIRPADDEHYAVATTQILAPSFGKEEKKSKYGYQYYSLTKRNLNNDETILLRFNIFELENTVAPKAMPKDVDGAYAEKNRISYPDEKTQIVYKEIDEIGITARSLSADQDSFVRQTVALLEDNQSLLEFLKDQMNVRNQESVVVEILKANNIHARTAHGFALQKQSKNLELVSWIEAYDSAQNIWTRHSFDSDIQDDLDYYYRWWTGNRDVVRTGDEISHSYNLSIRADNDDSITRALWLGGDRAGWLDFFALQSLPLEQQLVVQILLLLPLGALIASFFRQVIGIKTFGTFMPVLIALAFRETGLLYGVIFFLGVITTGLVARVYINRLHLLMVPRLSAVLSIVVIMIILLMLLTKNDDISLGISVALFPVVIITMFIERLSTILDEKGPMDAFYGLFGSLIAAIVIFITVLNSITMHILFTFPELLLVILAGCLLLGRYNGYKLTEYWRFKQLSKSA